MSETTETGTTKNQQHEESTTDTSETRIDEPIDVAEDSARLRKIGTYHFAAAMAALTLWGAGDTWAASSGMFLAEVVAVANALIAGIVLAFLCHEWGHFTGARLSSSVSPVLKDPVSFFMFNFKFEQNTKRQFLWMSIGGSTGNWLLVVLLLLLVPIDSASRAMLIATTIGVAISVGFFEIPVIRSTSAGGEPQAELKNRLDSGALTTGRNVGIATGAILWLVMAY